jgi:hypothetical protein
MLFLELKHNKKCSYVGSAIKLINLKIIGYRPKSFTNMANQI